MKKIIILGAGISGLAAGWYARKLYGNQCSLTFIEKSARVGGWIETTIHNGFLFEKGPKGFRPHGKGKWTLELVKELGLEKELIWADHAAKKRYVWLEDKLRAVSPLLLLRYASLSDLLKEWKRKPASLVDESIYAFFTRHFPISLVDNLIEPVVQGIFGGKSSSLSIRTCFPTLAKWEQEHGSLIKGLVQTKKEKFPSPLCSFRKGMETLPKAIFEALDAEYLFSTEATSIVKGVVTTTQGAFEADLILSSLPPQIPFLTLTTIHLGYHGKRLPKKGFGYLIPLKEEQGILGMTWDSQIFPQHNQGPMTRLCVMLRGEWNQETGLETVLKSVERHVGIKTLPHAVETHVSKQAIPQYPVGYKPPEHAPPLFYVGSSQGAVGINDCIFQAYKAVESTVT